MEQFFEFIVNHWIMTTLWIVLLMLLLRDNSQKSGQKLSTAEATALFNKGEALFLDIRDKGDFDKGHITDSKNIPLAGLKGRISELNSHQDAPIIVICKTGQTASMAGKLLLENGFKQVFRMNGGIMEWSNNNLPLVTK